MNPQDAMPADYGMYYDGCWMTHNKHGVGRIRVIDGRLYFEKNPGREDPIKVQGKSLSCWWPRPGAHNAKKQKRAVYIARRAMRNMRKSAIGGDHYFIKWGNPSRIEIMGTMRDGPLLTPLHDAMTSISNDGKAVAVARDIILAPNDYPSTYDVIFRGEEAGTYQHGVYTPLFSDNPLTGRILRQLEERQ